MSNEVCFFHLLRKNAAEESVHKLKMLVDLANRSKDTWTDAEYVDHMNLLIGLEEDLEKATRELQEAEEDLNQSLMERRLK